jgi:hypothetical protein
MAESLLNRWGSDRFRAFSAGSHPTGVVHPFAIELLKSMNFATDGLRSKSWDEFNHPDSPPVLSENSPGAIVVRFSSDPIIGRSWSDASESSLGVVS